MTSRAPGSASDPHAHGMVSAVLFAGAALLAIARWLPLRFEPLPNPQGSVSLTILRGYPAQKEMFWFGAAVAGGLVLAWAIARLLAGRRLTLATGIALEALAAGALLGMLTQQPALAEGIAAFAFALAVVVARSMPLEFATDGASTPMARTRSSGSRTRAVGWSVLFVAIALVLVPGLWARVSDVLAGTPDELLIGDGWHLQAEWGQFLAWADALSRGDLPGRDFYCLYGPLYVAGLWGFFGLLGRSIAAFQIYWALYIVLGVVAALATTAWHLRRRALALLVPLLTAGFSGRYGLALLALLLLSQGWVSSSLLWPAAAGMLGGVSLLVSQEFAAVFLVCAGLAWIVRGRGREPAVFLAGFALAVLPVTLWLAQNDALAPMLRDLVEYPSLVVQGFGKLPFPSLVALLPFTARAFDLDATALARLGATTCAICVAGVALVLRIDRLDLRAPLRSLGRLRAELAADPRRLALGLLAIFGVLAFRSALGRSSMARVAPVMPAAVALLIVAVDRSLDLWRCPTGARALLAWRLGLLAAIVFLGGFLPFAVPATEAAIAGTVAQLWRASGHEPPFTTSGFVDGMPLQPQPEGTRWTMFEVAKWLREHSEPADPLLFLPNQAAYYYLVDRPNPTRFALSHQMVTDDHRREALADLERTPPRYVVWLPESLRLDEIPHETYIGPDIMEWIRAHYQLEHRIDQVQILGRRPEPVAEAPGR